MGTSRFGHRLVLPPRDAWRILLSHRLSRLHLHPLHLISRKSFAFWLGLPGYIHSERWIGTIPEGWLLLTLIMYELESSNNAVDSDSMTAEGVKVIVQGAELVLDRH